MDNKFEPELEPLFRDLERELELYDFVSSNEFDRFCIKTKIKDYLNQRCEVLTQNRGAAYGFAYSLFDRGDALLYFLEDAYIADKNNFYNLLAKIIFEYEKYANKKVYMANIEKDLELLDEYDSYKGLFKDIGTRTKVNIPKEQPNESKEESAIDSNSVFIVHGHDEEMKLNVARTLEKLDLNPVILHEQANRGKTIIEKLEHCSDVSCAIILFSPDDVGNKKSEKDKLNDRARQNVVLELGYFMGKLGRGKVCVLIKESVEKPSDIDGILYIPYKDSWEINLAKELKGIGLEIDMNRLF